MSNRAGGNDRVSLVRFCVVTPPTEREHPMISRRRVLRTDAGPGRTLEADTHAARPALPQGLRGERVGQFGRADAERECAWPAVGAGMAVAADQGDPGKHETKLRSHDVNDPLTVLAKVEEADSGGRGTISQPIVQLLPGGKLAAGRPGTLETAWSGVANASSGLRTCKPDSPTSSSAHPTARHVGCAIDVRPLWRRLGR